MNQDELAGYITTSFAGVEPVTNAGDTFFFYNPVTIQPPDRMFPFVTLVTSDAYDKHSNLGRPGVYRLNIGVSGQTFRALFDTSEHSHAAATPDFTALNKLMPHPEYGRMHWLCILNPDDETLATQVHPLLVEAYDMAVRKRTKSASGV